MKKEIETPFFDNVKELWIKGIGVLEYEYKSKVLKLKTPDMLKPQWEVSNQKAFATNLVTIPFSTYPSKPVLHHPA
jgi:hypothetical protein